MPLPSKDFDPTEAGVTWKILTENKISVTLATPNGLPALGDQRMISGQGLGPWASFLKADINGESAYNSMKNSKEFLSPLSWNQLAAKDFSGLILTGGHAPGMKEYLESKILQNLVAEFFDAQKLVAAICHGTVLACRSFKGDGKSVLHGRKTTALLRNQELAAWALTCLWLKNYYRTYPETVQSEVTRSLAYPKDFLTGPVPIKRDSPQNLGYGFVVEDRNYISARWPGDAHLFGKTVAKYLTKG